MAKHKDLQPWLDYFGLLHTYEQKGFLELQPEKHEALITLPALLTLVPEVSSFMFQVSSGARADFDARADLQSDRDEYKDLQSDKNRITNAHTHSDGIANPAERELGTGILDAVRRIRAYSAFLAQQGSDYLTHLFALHVVGDEPPHDPLYTVLLTSTRSWRTAWRTKEQVEVIDYNEKMKSEE